MLKFKLYCALLCYPRILGCKGPMELVRYETRTGTPFQSDNNSKGELGEVT